MAREIVSTGVPADQNIVVAQPHPGVQYVEHTCVRVRRITDTNYSGTEFCARRIHLSTKLRSKENHKVLDAILGRDRDTEAVRAVFRTRSEPFPTPADGEIAVRMIIGNDSILSWHGRV